MHPKKGSSKPATRGGAPAATPVASSATGIALAARALLVLACAISLYLAYTSLTSSSIAGCGADSDCHQVLSSKWAYVAGVPISIPAAMLYIVTLAATFQAKRGREGAPSFLILAGSSAILAAALWFTAVQLFIIKRLCPYCMAAHVIGSVAALLLITQGKKLGWLGGRSISAGPITGIAGVAVAILLQATAPERPTYAVADYGKTNVTQSSPVPLTTSSVEKGGASTTAQVANASQAALPLATEENNASGLTTQAPQPTNYLLPIIQGAITLDLRTLPMEGSINAPHKIVKLFDFTCHHCRDLHHQLDQVRATFPDQIALVLLPIPLDSNCNAAIKRTPQAHVNACEYANIGLAVSRAAPEKFGQFSRWIFQPQRPPSLQDTRAFAAQLVGIEKFEKEIASSESYEQVQRNLAIYNANSIKGKSWNLPQLLFPNGAAFGSIKKIDDLYGMIRQHYGLSTNQ